MQSKIRWKLSTRNIDDLNKLNRPKCKLYDPSEHGGNLRYTIFKEREKEFQQKVDVGLTFLYNKTELYGEDLNRSNQDIIDGVFSV